MLKPIIQIKKSKTDYTKALLPDMTYSVDAADIIFRKKRSSKYVDIIKTFDIEAHNISQAKINEIINDIKNEFPELSIDDLPIGIVAKCYLGQPYEVHSLSLIGNVIIKHYKIQESLPADLEKARVLANNDRYAFVEVYKNKLIAVKNDGSTAVIERSK